MGDERILGRLRRPVLGVGGGVLVPARGARALHPPLGAPGDRPQPHQPPERHQVRALGRRLGRRKRRQPVGIEAGDGFRVRFGIGRHVPGGRGVERGVRQVDAGRAVERLLQVDDDGAAVGRDQEIARMGVEGNEGNRRRRLQGGGMALGRGDLGLDEAAGLGVDVGPGQIGRLIAHLVERGGIGIAPVGERRAVGRRRHRQAVDRRQRRGEARQVVGQPRHRSLDRLHDQRAHGHVRARRQRAVAGRRVAAGARPLEAGRLVGEVRARVEAHLALPRHAQEPARAGDAHMIVREPRGRQRLERPVRQVAVGRQVA